MCRIPSILLAATIVLGIAGNESFAGAEETAMKTGEYEFRIWQEKTGWLEKKYQVKIKAGETTEAKLNYTGDVFEDF